MVHRRQTAGGTWERTRRLRGIPVAMVLVAVVLAACAPAIAPRPSPAPSAPAPAPERTAPVVPRVALPETLGPSSWRVSSVARLAATGSGLSPTEQRVETRALVSWTLTRSASGSLRGLGQVDSFAVQSTLDTASGRPAFSPALLLLEATVDSALARVSTRPPLVNECDRPEASAAALARELLIRIPDGVAQGDRWRDSSATLVCRSGVPLVVYATTWSTLDAISDERLVVTRTVTTRLEGKGGSAFRALELTGSGTGTQRVEVRTRDGAVSTVDGTSTLTLAIRESAPPAAPRLSQLVQRVETRAERISR